MNWIYHTVRWFLIHWGYWAILIGLLGEDMGLPLPGETVLMFSAFLAAKTHQLSMLWIIVVGTSAAIMGDNVGFFLGRHFGRTLIRWVKKIFRQDDQDIAASKDLLKHHGKTTIFVARFIFGLRTVAGPLAGMLDMEWKDFLPFNAMGGAVWVTVMAFVGYVFAGEFATLLGYFEKASWALAAALFTTGYLLWRRYKKKYAEEHGEKLGGGKKEKDQPEPQEDVA